MKEKIQIKYSCSAESRVLHEGVLSVDTDDFSIHVHDGTTPNGHSVATREELTGYADTSFNNTTNADLEQMLARIAVLQGYNRLPLSTEAVTNILNKLGIASEFDRIGSFMYSQRSPVFDGVNPVLGTYLYADGHMQSCLGFASLISLLEAGELPVVGSNEEWVAKTDAFGNNGYWMYDPLAQQIRVPCVSAHAELSSLNGLSGHRVGETFKPEVLDHTHYTKVQTAVSRYIGTSAYEGTLTSVSSIYAAQSQRDGAIVRAPQSSDINNIAIGQTVIPKEEHTIGRQQHNHGFHVNVFVHVGSRVAA